ncbi:MAG: ATP synthase F1 subunit delta [Dehalococcoidales bacterium]|nr:MAG: ATP synthase F1 subunit delta [Dehalococcoidales bacterium]
MSDTYAVEHAKQIFSTALENNELNIWQVDLRNLASLTRDKTLIASLENPDKAIDEKAKLLAERLGEAKPDTLKLVSELINKGKLDVLEEISFEYQRLLDTHRGIEGTEIAELTTAIPLDDEYILDISKRLTEMIGKPVVVNTKVDPGLVGGIIIKIGDKVMDGSIKNKLAALKRELGRAAG